MLRAEVNWDICQACDPCSARLVCKTRAVLKIDADAPAFIELARWCWALSARYLPSVR